ncbi:hypothetical protein HY991_02840 [Candidatus Micrarchaeota archaeon]|nr:hypothetical protein [Candidatus Micrarchaeota archaeon]
MKPYIDLRNLKPAEAGLFKERAVGLREVYATFADLVVRDRISVLGTAPKRVFSWFGDRKDLNEFESLVVEACFSSRSSITEMEVRAKLDRIDLKAFGAGVALRAVRKGFYYPSFINLALLTVAHTKKEKFMESLIYFYLAFPLLGFLVYLAVVLFEQSATALFIVLILYLTATAFLLLRFSYRFLDALGHKKKAFLDLVTVLFLVVVALTVAIDVFYQGRFQEAARAWIFLLGACLFFQAIAYYYAFYRYVGPAEYHRSLLFLLGLDLLFCFFSLFLWLPLYLILLAVVLKGIDFTDFESFLTFSGKQQRKKYYQLFEYVIGYEITKRYIGQELEPYAIAFGLRKDFRQIPPQIGRP